MRQYGTGSGGSFAWFFQRVSGVFLVVFLLGHFWLLHYAVSGEFADFDSVRARLALPLFRVLDLVFLYLAVYHGLNGVLMVIHDYVHHGLFRLVLIALLWVLGLTLLTCGTLTIATMKV